MDIGQIHAGNPSTRGHSSRHSTKRSLGRARGFSKSIAEAAKIAAVTGQALSVSLTASIAFIHNYKLLVGDARTFTFGLPKHSEGLLTLEPFKSGFIERTSSFVDSRVGEDSLHQIPDPKLFIGRPKTLVLGHARAKQPLDFRREVIFSDWDTKGKTLKASSF